MLLKRKSGRRINHDARFKLTIIRCAGTDVQRDIFALTHVDREHRWKNLPPMFRRKTKTSGRKTVEYPQLEAEDFFL